MTDDPATEARRLLDGISWNGEWVTENDGIYNASRSYMVVPTGDSSQDRRDAAFIAAAPRLLAALAGECERLRAKIAVVYGEAGRR